ncbi:MAG: amidohydrolase family protein [Oscillospiraceae bacterium]
MEPQIDIIVKNGHVIDPADGMDKIGNIGINNGKSLGFVGDNSGAEIEIDAAGCYVFPGLIDFHTHIYTGGSSLGVNPDVFPSMGVTTAVDAGTTGCSNFRAFYGSVVAHSAIRINSYINVCSYGQPGDGFPEDFNPDMFCEDKICRLFDEFPGHIVGLKIRMDTDVLGGRGLTPLVKAKEMAAKIGCPVVVHASNPPTPESELAALLDAGDVFCHCFHGKGFNILDGNGHVQAEIWRARERGVIFDCCNGITNCSHDVARKALNDGFLPEIISTDMCAMIANQDGHAKNLPFVMSKYLSFGMTINDVIRAVTDTPAHQLGLDGKAGTLKSGAYGDLVVCRRMEASPVFLDSALKKYIGNQLLVPIMTIKDGNIMYRQTDF